jgi:oxygen-dependent protoporphyrinogen oxidase
VDGDLNPRMVDSGTIAAGHVVVIGGGIAGLAAAHRLLQSAPGTRVTLLETADRLGGTILTERVDEFIVEGGPDSFLASKPRGIGLSEEVGIAATLQGVTHRPRRAYVLSRGQLHELPEGLSGLVPSRLAPLARSRLLSPAGKARVALDYLLPRRAGQNDESLGGFIRRRLGGEAWERLVEPLMAGIYAAHGDQLSLAATFPQLRDAERQHGSLIRGVRVARAATAALAPAGSAFLTPTGGLGTLVTAIATRLQDGGVTIRTGACAVAVSRGRSSPLCLPLLPSPPYPPLPSGPGEGRHAVTNDGYVVHLATGETIDADAVIVATPAHVAAGVLRTLDSPLAAELDAIPHASTALVSLAYRREEIPHPLDAHGYVVSRAEGGPVLACTWTSRKWPGRAPDGWELLRVFLGRLGREAALDQDDAALITLARAELESRLGVRTAPALTRVHRWPRGMPQYVLGHPARIARIETALAAHPGLALAGNAYRGVGIPDCIASGERAAALTAAHVRRATVRSSAA